MSTSTTKSPSLALPRPYIGSRRNRNYINNNVNSSSLSSDYLSSPTLSSESAMPIQSEQNTYLSNARRTVDLSTQEEERLPVTYFSYMTSRDDQQRNLQENQKAEEVSPTSSSSSLFLRSTIHDATPLSVDDHSSSSSSYVKEQQDFYKPTRQYEQYSFWQPLNNKKENNQLTTLESSEQLPEEEQKQKQSGANSILFRHHNFDLSDVPEEENSSLASSLSLTDTAENNNNIDDNQAYLLTSAAAIAPFIPDSPTASSENFALISQQNNNVKSLSLPLDGLDDQSSTISTTGLVTDLQRKSDIFQSNHMSSSSSSVRYATAVGPIRTTTPHTYDQQISDQGDKYIIQLKTDEYHEDEFKITPRYVHHQIVIDAKHREEDSLGGYVHRELHKIFNIPKHIDLNQYAYSYNKDIQELTIEMPSLQTASTDTSSSHKDDSILSSSTLHTSESNTHSHGNVLPMNSARSTCNNEKNNTSSAETTSADAALLRISNAATTPAHGSSIGSTKPFDFDLFHRSVFRPQIVKATTDSSNNDKKLIMSLDLSDYQPEDIKVSVKDRELIVNAERKIETDTRKSRTSFFQSTSLPPQTDIEHLHSNYVDGKLVIEAPYLEQSGTQRRILSSNSSSLTTSRGLHWPTVTESQQTITTDDPYRRRTEISTEFIRTRLI